MYKLVIVDDDIHVINGFQRKIDWDLLNVEIIGTALNGRQAMEVIKKCKPDIIMTDIKMPIMDGIELIKEIDRMDLDIKVVILSGYGEFEFAKQAIKYNAVEYLLKPTSSEEIINLIKRLVQALDDERLTEEKKKQEQTVLFEHSLLEKLKDNSDNNNFSDLILSSKYEVGEKDCVVASFICIHSNNSEYSIKDIIQTSYDKKNIFMRWDESHWLFLMFYSNKDGCAEAEKAAFKAMNLMRNKINTKKNISLMVSIGLVAKCINDIRESVEDAFNLLEYGSIRRQGAIIESKNNNNIKSDIAGLKLVEKKIISAINEEDKKSLLHAIDEFYRLVANQQVFSKKLLMYTLTLSFKTIMMCRKYLEATQESPSEYLLWQELVKNETINDLKDCVILICTDFFESLACQTDYGAPIKYAINYIEENYMSPIYIKDIAANLFFSENYLTSLFKKEAGISFKKYLTAVRMKHTKEFLTNPEYQMQEIATMVGYKNEEYFSKIFKTTTGLSPSEYRKTITYNID